MPHWPKLSFKVFLLPMLRAFRSIRNRAGKRDRGNHIDESQRM